MLIQLSDEQLVAYLYNEVTPVLKSKIDDLLLVDEQLLDRYLVLAEAKMLLMEAQFEVPKHLVNKLLNSLDTIVGNGEEVLY
jgi:hypothetical protein